MTINWWDEGAPKGLDVVGANGKTLREMLPEIKTWMAKNNALLMLVEGLHKKGFTYADIVNKARWLQNEEKSENKR